MSNLNNKRQKRAAASHIAKGVGTTALLSLIVAINTAYAQEAAKQDAVVVTGIRKGIEDAISVKKDSNSIVEVVTAEDIGKLPDQSIAESIARLPGLTAQRVAGRAQTISIRGLSGDFSTALLNGREQVSTSDNRGVEFDQYPAELLGSVVVYKTPNSGLVGQGLSGTIDMQTVRPLSFPGRTIALNVRGERTGVGNEGLTGPGNRFSASYIDQFANRTVGIALGFARLETTTLSNRYESWGTAPAVSGGVTADASTGFKTYRDTTKKTRNGLMAVVEYKPNKDFSSVLDLFYSKNEEKVDKKGLEAGLNDSWAGADAGVLTNATADGGRWVSGTWSNVRAVLANNQDFRKDELTSIGWNNKLNMGDGWAVSADLSYSKAQRRETLLESNSGTLNPGGAQGAFTFSPGPNNSPIFSIAGVNYADPSIIKLTDAGGWGQDGYIKYPKVDDQLKSIRLSGQKSMDGMFSKADFGVNLADRSKQREVNEFKLKLINGPVVDVPSPGATAAGSGITILSYDPQSALGLYGQTPNYDKDIWNKDWIVKEKVLTAFGKLDIDTTFAGDLNLKGDVGLQIVNTDQSSTAYSVNIGAGGGPNPSQVNPFSDGKKYTDVLPSLNLAMSLPYDQTVRFGLGRVIARAKMDQLRASNNYEVDTALAVWKGSGGNPKLDPFRADAVDIAYEKYFGKKAYVGAAAFYKSLKSYVFEFTDPNYDFTGRVNNSGVTPPLTTGKFTTPQNGKGGKISGIEVAVSVPFSLVSPVMDGFGVVASYADTTSQIKPFGEADAKPLPGLSKQVSNLTLYYEKYGFSTRISQRQRSDYLGEITGFGADRAYTYIKGESVVDMQVGYEFQDGPAKGLSALVQVYNLTNEPYTELDISNAGLTSVKKSVKYGKTILFGLNYKFQ